MGKVIDFPDMEASILFERTEAFWAEVKRLSDCIKELPINAAQDNDLQTLMLSVIHEASQGAFMHGFALGTSIQGI